MGCRVCRARKVKCDGRPNGCHNCERLQLDCVADDGTAAVAATAAAAAAAATKRSSPLSLKKMRTYRSCATCRLSKTKCDGDRPRCGRCASKHIECVYNGGAAPRWTRNLQRPSSSFAEGRRGSDPGLLAHEDKERSAFLAGERRLPPRQDDTPSITSGPSAEGSLNEQQGIPDVFISDAQAWLVSPSLPEGRNLRRVVDQYFANLHPLRCFAFVHKPTFMRQVDKGLTTDDESALLHIVCAHGAKFLSLSLVGDHPTDTSLISAAGNQWAKRAEYLLLANFGKISMQRLMTAILIHEFHFRHGEYSQALMMSGLAVRMAHALKINTEHSPDIMCAEKDDNAPSVVSRESRRRLMWSCYILDAWAGSGVDQLTLLRENDIKIQLPCNERNFGLRIPCVTETLGVGHVLQFLSPSVVPPRPAENMGIMAYYIRIVTLWKKIVRYVNRLDSRTDASPPPWLPESDFTALDADLRRWRRELPDFVEYSAETIYARLDSNQLGALVLIHCTYHHNYLELYKLSMPDLFKLSKPLSIPPEHQDFFHAAQANCYYHAQQIADILAEAADHGARLLSDSLLPYFVYDSSRVMLYYVARLLDPNRVDAQDKVRDAIQAVESNNRVLRMMVALFPNAQSLSITIERWLYKLKQATNREDLLDKLQSESRADIPGAVLPSSPPSSPQDNTELTLPSISLHSLTHTGVSARSAADGPADLLRPDSISWSAPSAPAATQTSSWDHMNAAQQLAGLSSQDSPIRTGLQHERPVMVQQSATQQQQQQKQRRVMPAAPMYEALDLDDLQNFLSWDMYGIRDMGEPILEEGTEDMMQSWAGAI